MLPIDSKSFLVLFFKKEHFLPSLSYALLRATLLYNLVLMEFSVQPTESPCLRMLPELTPETAPFWSAGAQGRLLIARCNACGHWIHPPMPVCARCLSRDIMPAPVSGRGTVHSFTINHQAFLPGMDVPFAIAIVELPEQEALRLTTNIVDCPPEAVHIGMEVTVRFLPQGDIYLPLFAPVQAAET
jgi:uncharacterized OB-fold protein